MAAPTTGFEDSALEDAPWTTITEEQSFIQSVADDTGRLLVDTVGQSAVDANPIRMIAVGYPAAPTVAELKAKSVVLVVGGQHGNEPSGRQASLHMIRDLAYTTDPSMQAYLSAHPILFVPTVNPDSVASSRTNKNGVDNNHHWLSYQEAENKAVGTVIRDYSPDIMLDLHESGKYAKNYEFLHATNPEVDSRISTVSQSLHSHIRGVLAGEGYTTALYSGISEPHILRNAGGLQGIITILVEAAGQDQTGTPTRKAATTGYGTVLREAFNYHRDNAALIKHTTAQARVTARQNGEDMAAITSPSITPSLGYTLTPTQYATASVALDRLSLRAYPLTGGAGYYVPMSQGTKRMLPFLADGASTKNIITATAVYSEPGLEVAPARYNTRVRVVGGTDLERAGLALTGTSRALMGLASETDYEWQVQEQGPTYASAWATWQAFSTAESVQYNIEYRDVQTQTTASATVYNTLSYEVINLTPATDYEFRVQEDDGSLQSAWSAWAPFATLSAGDDLTANDISSTSQVSPPSIGQSHALTPTDATSTSSVTSPAIGQTHGLTATDVQSTSQVSTPTLSSASTTDSLTANDISSASAVTSPALGQVHNIAANDVASASETGTPTLRQEHAITSVSLDSLSTVSSPTLQSVAGQDSLAANDISSASSVSSPELAQVHVLQSAITESNTETSQPAIAQAHKLTANELTANSSVSTPTIRDASQTLATPIKNTKATAVTVTYKAAIIQTVYKAEAG